MSTRRDELVRDGSAAVRRAGLPRDLDGRPRRGDGRAEGLALLADRVEAGAPRRGHARGRRGVPRGARRRARGRDAAIERIRARAARPPAGRGRAARRGHRVHPRVALPRGRAARRLRRRAPPLRGALARAVRDGVERGGLRVGPRRRARPRCSSSRPPTGPTRGSGADVDTDALADRFTAILVDGVRGYATRPRPRERPADRQPVRIGGDRGAARRRAAALALRDRGRPHDAAGRRDGARADARGDGRRDLRVRRATAPSTRC